MAALSDSDVESARRGQIMEMRPLKGGSRRVGQEDDGQDQHRVGTKEELIRAWGPIFERFDHDHDGRVPLAEFRHMLTGTPEGERIPKDVLDDILERADYNRDGYLDFEEFLQMVRGHTIGEHRPMMRSLVRYAAWVVVPKSDRRGTVRRYINEYSCWPPPLFIPLISVLEIALFAYYTATMSKGWIGPVGPIPEESDLIYDPFRRYQAWRFLTYMLVHAGWTHIIFNVLIQVVLGVPLEMVHHWWRIMLIYFLGVVAGSLGTSISDPEVYLVGASAGVYALMSAHLSAVIMNWSEMDFGFVRLMAFIVLIGTDIGVAIYYRYQNVDTKTGYAAHIGGGMAGLLLGIVVLRNLRERKWEAFVWWIALALFCAMILGMVVWNVAFPSYFPGAH